MSTPDAALSGTFAIGGSLTGYLGKRIMPLFGIETPWIYIPVYILLVTLIWPMMVLLISIPFGQFKFFTGYLKKMGQRMGLVPPKSPKRGVPEHKASLFEEVDKK